jgi:hypothetical protein
MWSAGKFEAGTQFPKYARVHVGLSLKTPNKLRPKCLRHVSYQTGGNSTIATI